MHSSSKGIKKLWIAGSLAVVALLIVGLFYWLTHNYAQEAASSFEAALAKEGAIKKCDIGSNGLGPDDRTPWYSAIYEIPAGQEPAISLVKQAASASGFSLTEEYPNINREDNRFLGDSSSKASGYFGLKSGKQQLSVTVFGSKEYDPSARFCSAKNSSDSSKTTINLQLSLPDYR
jgi:hypothetical protein